MALETVAARPERLTSEERWTAWVAKGVEHDRKMTARARTVLVAIAAGMVLALSLALLG